MDALPADQTAAQAASGGADTPLAGGIVTLRYWAAARAAAGRSDEQFSGASLADVLASALQAHQGNPRFAQVLGVSSLLVGDRPLGKTDPASIEVTHGDVIDILPPFAGG
jgi:molybdopterin synthase sulfur carrier subunit